MVIQDANRRLAQLLGLKSLSDRVMTLVAYGSFEICNTAIHQLAMES